MAKYQYKSRDGQDYSLPGIGSTVNGIIDTDEPIESANFVLVPEAERVEPAPENAPVTPPVEAPAGTPEPPVEQPPVNNEQTNTEGNQ